MTNESQTNKAQQIFAASLAKVKSTGSVKVDQIARKIVTKIWDNSLEMEQVESGFSGTVGQTTVKVLKVPNGKTNRYSLRIGDLELGGPFAAKAWNYSTSQHKEDQRGQGKSVEYDEAQVAEIAEQLGLA